MFRLDIFSDRFRSNGIVLAGRGWGGGGWRGAPRAENARARARAGRVRGGGGGAQVQPRPTAEKCGSRGVVVAGPGRCCVSAAAAAAQTLLRCAAGCAKFCTGPGGDHVIGLTRFAC
jgi:hypothetical protein